VLVLIGVRADGRKELVALADGYRESTESWGTCCVTAPGMRAPVLAVGDAAARGWGRVALGDVEAVHDDPVCEEGCRFPAAVPDDHVHLTLTLIE
jgi:hypothetical protein